MAALVRDGPAASLGPQLPGSDDDPDVVLVDRLVVVVRVEARAVRVRAELPQIFEARYTSAEETGVELPDLGVGGEDPEDDDALTISKLRFLVTCFDLNCCYNIRSKITSIVTIETVVL